MLPVGSFAHTDMANEASAPAAAVQETETAGAHAVSQVQVENNLGEVRRVEVTQYVFAKEQPDGGRAQKAEKTLSMLQNYLKTQAMEKTQAAYSMNVKESGDGRALRKPVGLAAWETFFPSVDLLGRAMSADVEETLAEYGLVQVSDNLHGAKAVMAMRPGTDVAMIMRQTMGMLRAYDSSRPAGQQLGEPRFAFLTAQDMLGFKKCEPRYGDAQAILVAGWSLRDIVQAGAALVDEAGTDVAAQRALMYEFDAEGMRLTATAVAAVGDAESTAYAAAATRTHGDNDWYYRWRSTEEMLFTTEVFAYAPEVTKGEEWSLYGAAGGALCTRLEELQRRAMDEMSQDSYGYGWAGNVEAIKGFPVRRGEQGITRLEIRTSGIAGGARSHLQAAVGPSGRGDVSGVLGRGRQHERGEIRRGGRDVCRAHAGCADGGEADAVRGHAVRYAEGRHGSALA